MISLSASVLMAAATLSIAGRPDVSEERYLELAAPFHAVGGVGNMGTGTLIAEQWVVTAAHVADFLRLQKQTSIIFKLDDGREFTVDDVVTHPGWTPLEVQIANRKKDSKFTAGDIALLHLSEKVEGVAPIPMGAFNPEQPEVTLVGIGAFVADPDNGISPRAAMSLPRGVKYAGTNRIDRVDESRQELIFNFTPPGGEGGTLHEASAFAGDSGGPILAKTPAGWTIVGVMGAVEAVNDVLGDYGDETGATSIGAVQDWITKQIAN